MKKVSCGKNSHYNGFAWTKCGDKDKYSDYISYCDDCDLKNKGILVGKKFYQISYCFTRRIYEYEILKLNEKSVRMRCTFLDGSQEPQEYSITNEETLKRFQQYSKTFKGAVSLAVKNNEKAIKEYRETLKELPKQIKITEEEIKELNNINFDALVSGDEQ